VLNNAVMAKNLANCGGGDRHERMVGWATTKVNIDTTDACDVGVRLCRRRSWEPTATVLRRQTDGKRPASV
jgi:hypothetical protein